MINDKFSVDKYNIYAKPAKIICWDFTRFFIRVYEVLIFFMFFMAAWKINQKW